MASGYLPGRRASPPFGRFQIVLLGDRGIWVLTTFPELGRGYPFIITPTLLPHVFGFSISVPRFLPPPITTSWLRHYTLRIPCQKILFTPLNYAEQCFTVLLTRRDALCCHPLLFVLDPSRIHYYCPNQLRKLLLITSTHVRMPG